MYNCTDCNDTKKSCTMNCYSYCKSKTEIMENCEDCDVCYTCRNGLKFQAVVSAWFGTEKVGSLVFGKYETRLEAEQAVENAESNEAAKDRRKVLTKLYSGSMIATYVELIKGA